MASKEKKSDIKVDINQVFLNLKADIMFLSLSLSPPFLLLMY